MFIVFMRKLIKSFNTYIFYSSVFIYLNYISWISYPSLYIIYKPSLNNSEVIFLSDY